MSIDEAKLNEFLGKAVGDLGAAISATLMLVGDALQSRAGNTTLTATTEPPMPRYVIEREIPGTGKLSALELKAIAQKSCSVLQNMGPQIQWQHSYVTGDKVYCVYIAPDEATIREHARLGGFPANSVSEVKSVIDPVTSE